MFKKNEVMATVNGLYTALTENLNALCANRVAVLKGISGKGIDDAFAIIEDINSSLTLLVKNTLFNGVGVKFTSRVQGNGFANALSSVDLTISSARNAGYKYRNQVSFSVDENIAEKLAEEYRKAAVDILYGDYAYSNVEELNASVAEFTNDCAFKVRFAVSDDYVTDINNDTVVFGIGVNEALNLSETADKLIYNGTTEEEADAFKKAIVNSVREEFVEFLNTASNTVSIIAAKNPVIAEVTGVTAKRRPDKYIRCILHKNAKYLSTCKKGVGYFQENINGTDVFAIVSKDENGLKVVLNPYDIESNLNVDVDVLAQL